MEAGIAGNPPPQIPLVVCARFAEERRRIRAGRLIRPPTKILGRRFTRNRPPDSYPPRLSGERTARFVSLFSSLSSLPFLAFPISLLRSLAASFSPIKFDLESFGRVHEISRRYEGERKREEWDKGMEILTLARLPRGLIVSWPLVGLIGR